MTSATDIKEALKQVIDPELGYNIVDLGLVYDVDVDSDLVRILLTTTTKGCPATEFIREGVERCAAAIADKAEVTMTWDPPWSPEKMSDEAKAYFGFAATGPPGRRR
ncbi:MAG: metal-sulfur cluster assembly factor [Alphaproteobacteria bacterium]|nr:metal-sulfur cluster assembly factor [Alphaproteobacteria bacterium]MDE2494684.1 metal-sulfur cluster assembly factor [Alphaproteobacteria bacterium]